MLGYGKGRIRFQRFQKFERFSRVINFLLSETYQTSQTADILHLHRQIYRKPASPSRGAFNFYFSAVGVYDLLYKTQTQTEAFCIVRFFMLYTEKMVEYFLELFFFNTNAIVCNGKISEISCVAGMNADRRIT